MKRSKHSLSHTKLFSCDLGEIIPIGCMEVLPGDSIQQSTQALVRAAPLLSPVMHPVKVTIAHWYVPNRLIWEDWEDFITGGPDGLDDSVHPVIDIAGRAGVGVGTLSDYFGIPTNIPAGQLINALPFRAYALIFNEWYRDQDLVSKLALSVASGTDATTSISIQNGGWEKDYFTSARPWEAKGPSITVPLGTTAPVTGIGTSDAGSPGGSVANQRQSDGTTVTYTNAEPMDSTFNIRTTTGAGAWRPQIFADLSSASAITINVLREALALQRYQEARARYGSRYSEYLAYLGVNSSDARLQRPEYLGGGQETIQFSEVLQTAEGDEPVGTLRGHGISSMRSNRYRRFFEEHGFVISVLIARPRAIYASGLQKHWIRAIKEDYWQRELEHIGQAEILNREVYSAHSSPTGVFGYQDRYDEYRRHWSSIAGEFRTTLNYWHFARVFSSNPALNADFVKCVPVETPFAVPSEDVLQIHARHSIQARRLVTKVGTSFIY